MTGHATDEEIKAIRELEVAMNQGQASTDDLLRLGQLYIEPLHKEDEAIKIFKRILEQDPNNIWARYWLSRCYIYYIMEHDALLEAMPLLQNADSTDLNAQAAVYELLATLQDDLGNTTPQYKIELLKNSVRLQPGWVHNRMALAWAYQQQGMLNEAIHELNQAKSNIIDVDPTWSAVQRNFEEVVTGRAANHVLDRINAMLRQLR